MDNKNFNYFDIFNYIAANLEEPAESKDSVIVCLNEDCNNEPYIEITYIDENGNSYGLNTNMKDLRDITSYTDNYSSVFGVSEDDSVASIVYDSFTQKLSLLKYKNGSYIGRKFIDDFENAIFVGYIINKNAELNYVEKIKVLYGVMKEIMSSVYNEDYENEFVFKVKDEEIRNVYSIADFNDGYDSNEDVDSTDAQNIEIIESVYKIKLNEESYQKTK